MENYFVHPGRICTVTNRLVSNHIRSRELNQDQLEYLFERYNKAKKVKYASILAYYLAEKILKNRSLEDSEKYSKMDKIYKELEAMIYSSNIAELLK